jgi:hypothetical protein
MCGPFGHIPHAPSAHGSLYCLSRNNVLGTECRFILIFSCDGRNLSGYALKVPAGSVESMEHLGHSRGVKECDEKMLKENECCSQ